MAKVKSFFWINKFNAWLDAKISFLQAVILLVIIFSVRTFLFGLYWVPTGSMEPTILVGESFFADKFTPLFMPIKRGDIISLMRPILLILKISLFVFSKNMCTVQTIGRNELLGFLETVFRVKLLMGKLLFS